MRLFRGALLVAVWLGVLPNDGFAQSVSPSQVTPQSLRPAVPPTSSGVMISSPNGISAPKGAEKLFVRVNKVVVEGEFPELAAETGALAQGVENQRVSVAAIYAFANALEQAYARKGYVLARIVVPPQRLRDGGDLRVTVIDGYIEAVKVDGVPERVRKIVAARAGVLVGRRHVNLSDIERPVLLAGDVVGLRLRSTLARGTEQDGTILVLEGEQKLVMGSLGVDNRLPASLGGWSTNVQLALNSAFGFGEQIYGSLATGTDLAATANGDAPLRTVGLGAVVPLGINGFTLNPEYTLSQTKPLPVRGAPRMEGTFERMALRAFYPWERTRARSINLTGGLEYLEQRDHAVDFNRDIDHDRYLVLRLGVDSTIALATSQTLSLKGTLSEGLGGRSPADAAASGVPLTRQGASPNFTKFSGEVRFLQPLPENFVLAATILGQTSFGSPLLQSERLGLDGFDAVSAFKQGVLVADQGVMARAEFGRPFDIRGVVTLAPYVFGAVGWGITERPTAVEHSQIQAQAVGGGVRTNLTVAAGWPGVSLGIEGGRGFSNIAGQSDVWRVNATASVRF